MNLSTAFNEDEEFGENPNGSPDGGDILFGDVPNVPRELKNRMHLLDDQIAELYDILADDAARSTKAVERMIVERPLVSTLFAFSLGCFAGLLLRPSRR